jgi:hypothetical protein
MWHVAACLTFRAERPFRSLCFATARATARNQAAWTATQTTTGTIFLPVVTSTGVGTVMGRRESRRRINRSMLGQARSGVLTSVFPGSFCAGRPRGTRCTRSTGRTRYSAILVRAFRCVAVMGLLQKHL